MKRHSYLLGAILLLAALASCKRVEPEEPSCFSDVPIRLMAGGPETKAFLEGAYAMDNNGT